MTTDINSMSFTPAGLSIRPLEPAQIRAVYKERMTVDFPPDELKSLAIIERAIRRSEYRCYGGFIGENIAAYAFFVTIRERGETVWLFDYLAVEQSRRDQGIGSAFLQALQREVLPEADAVLLEIDDPDFAEGEERLHRLRRERFYHRNGLVDTGVTANVFGVDFKILEVPRRALHDRETCQDYYRELYRRLLPSDMFSREVKV